MMGLLHLEDPEEIHGVSCMEPDRVPATPAQADAAHHSVQGPSQEPKTFRRVPTCFTSDSHDRFPHLLGSGLQNNPVTGLQDISSAVGGIPAVDPFGNGRLSCICPTGLDTLVADAAQGKTDGISAGHQFLRNESPYSILPADNRILESLCQRPGNV